MHGDIHAEGNQQVMQLIDGQLMLANAVAERQKDRMRDRLVLFATLKQCLPGIDLLDAHLRRRFSLVSQIVGMTSEGINSRYGRPKIGTDQPGGGGKVFVMLFGDLDAVAVSRVKLHRLAGWRLLHGCMLATGPPFRKR